MLRCVVVKLKGNRAVIYVALEGGCGKHTPGCQGPRE
jgi:hypothetical protein